MSLKGQVVYQNKYFTHLMKKLDSLDFFESFKITLHKKRGVIPFPDNEGYLWRDVYKKPLSEFEKDLTEDIDHIQG